MDWVEALNKALAYIEDNLLEEITCKKIANHVYISNAHFQKAFYAMTGYTIGEYIRNRRLTLAGHELSVSNAKVIDIAFKYGYETSESFSKAFTRYHGITPSLVKRKGVNLKSFNRLTIKIIMEGGSVMNYRIEKKEAFSVVVKAKTFSKDNSIFGDNSLSEIPSYWDEYFAEELEKKISPDLGVCGPVVDGSDDFWYGIGCFERDATEIPDGFVKWDISDNTWAIFKCEGEFPESIGETWKQIYSEWLPQAKYEFVPSYDIEYYTCDENDNIGCEIWVPVKEK